MLEADLSISVKPRQYAPISACSAVEIYTMKKIFPLSFGDKLFELQQPQKKTREKKTSEIAKMIHLSYYSKIQNLTPSKFFLVKKTSITQLWAAFPICTAHVCPDLVDISLVLSTSTFHLSRETWRLISQTSHLQVFLFWLRKVRSLIEKTQTSKSWLVFISPLRVPMTWSWKIACNNWVYSWFLLPWFGKQTKTVWQ